MATIHLLPRDQIKFVKKIFLNNNQLDEHTGSFILYTRNFCKEYTMNYSKATTAEIFLKQYGEHCYPKDALDDIIKLGVDQMFPSSTTRTSLLMFQEGKEWLSHILFNFNKLNFHININPDGSDLNKISKSGKTSFRVVQKDLALYYPKVEDDELFKNAGAVIYYDIDYESLLTKIEPQLLHEVGNLF